MFPNINKILLFEKYKEIYKIKGEIEYNKKLYTDNIIRFLKIPELNINVYIDNNIPLMDYVETIDCKIEKYIDCAGFEDYYILLTEENKDILNFTSIIKKSEHKSLISVGFDSCREAYREMLCDIGHAFYVNFKINEDNIYKIIDNYLIEDDIHIIINDEYLDRNLGFIQTAHFLNFVSNKKYKHDNLFIRISGIVYSFKEIIQTPLETFLIC